MTINRRNLLKSGVAATTMTAFMNNRLFAEEDAPHPKSNKFLIYIHFGSSCGAANGLLQPIKPGSWPTGFFQNGAPVQSNNPLLNTHTQAGGLVLHDYLKFLAPMANEMCLVEGTSQSLDHNVAALLQKRGAGSTSISPEWSMGVTQFMRTDKRLNPMVLTRGNKTHSVTDVTPVAANSIDEFKVITSDVNTIPKDGLDPIWNTLKNRFKKPGMSSVITEASLEANSSYQLNTLKTGLPELSAAQADITALRAMLAQGEITKLIAGCADKAAIGNVANGDGGFKEKLILAGILAKTGLANGMSIDAFGDDLHGGGADVTTARNASAKWASISQFWAWIKAANLQNDVMIVVGQEFARSPYNPAVQDINIVDASGKTVTVKSPGRDHALCMGMMFINGNVPKAGRIGFVGNNMVPQATKDAIGTIDSSGAPYTSENMVGSMLMRCFDDIFPTERMVRKHWPTFKEISPILA
ncbi:MAG: hypothetical protein EOP07_16500 [Proteobacteria bacterium]|nr:MAG: hypothetical protein EOP07_16500 [Pseudomonadota bacterium]